MSIFQNTPPQCDSPSWLSILLEARAPWELASLGLYSASLSTAAKGDRRPVILVPGYMADDNSMWPLKRYLKFLGYRVYDSGMGRNHGSVNKDTQLLGKRCERVSTELDTPVTLIGWSLGGVLTREAARLFPSNVREVITMGTPIIGGPKFTSIGKIYAKSKNLNMQEFELMVHQRNSIGLDQPITSIYSKTDGVVGWQASIDIYNDHARNIEVVSSHLGLGVHPKVWRIIAGTLAENKEQI
jgi:pimeloyl-ACP methyl ester carboxylesterase